MGFDDIFVTGSSALDCLTLWETIARNSGSGLGKIQNASMGVFQITATNGNEDYSYGGAFNTSSRFNTASVTTKIDYAVD